MLPTPVEEMTRLLCSPVGLDLKLVKQALKAPLRSSRLGYQALRMVPGASRLKLDQLYMQPNRAHTVLVQQGAHLF